MEIGSANQPDPGDQSQLRHETGAFTSGFVTMSAADYESQGHPTPSMV
jgi:hypothetical protein